MSLPLFNSLLKEVSRSFYLTMRVLPGAIRPQISLAYLLARTTDTIADTDLVALDKRLEALQLYGKSIQERKAWPLPLGQIFENQTNSSESKLLQYREYILSLLHDFSKPDQQLICNVLEIIISGQELDLKRFAGANENQIIALQTEADLDDYTYRVAGCVGKFWTKICLAHQFSSLEILSEEHLSKTPETFFEELGIRFGKGLQLVNVLRDLPRDLRNGRCYLPADKLAEAGLAPADLLQPANETKLRPLYHRYLDLTQSHLAAGWKYTNLIPRSQMRVRLACAWPILIGMKTIGKLRETNVLNSEERVKISRTEIRNLICKSIVLYPFPHAWESQFCTAARTSKCC